MKARFVHATILIDAEDPAGDAKIHRTLQQLGLILLDSGHENLVRAELVHGEMREERAPSHTGMGDPSLN